MRGARIRRLMPSLLVPCLAAAGALASGATEGRTLYHGTAPFAKGLEATSTRLPAAFAACANCHGHSGAGGSEGGVTAPPLLWSTLMKPRDGLPPYRSADQVLRAITGGVGRGGVSLLPVMPRYRLSDAETGSLAAYLEIIGTDADLPPGVSVTEIRIGTALPLSGPAVETGQAVLSGLRDILDPVNARGGIHGRQVRLLTADTMPRGARAAVQDLVAKPVYAMVASIWPGDDRDIERLLAERRVANLASLVVRTHGNDAGEWDADLLPPLDEQQKRLATAMETCGGAGDRMALPVGVEEPDPGATRWWGTGPELEDALRQSGKAGCVGFGLASARLSPRIPQAWQQRIVLPMPAPLVEADDAGGGPWRRLGQAAGQVLVELLSVAGATPHERSALEAVPSLRGFEPLPGLALNFSRTRRYGWDAAVVTVPARTDSPGPTQDPAPGSDNGG